MKTATPDFACEIRPIRPSDDAGVADLIRAVMPEFGASGPGFAIHDPEVAAMSANYADARSIYFVVEADGKILGGGGIAPLVGGDEQTCELRKMYFRRELRGKGIGQRVLDLCLEAARQRGFRHMYLETLRGMEKARALYQRNSFVPLSKPMGKTGHFGCDSWFQREL